MSPILILDTSTDRGLVALTAGGKLLFVYELPVGTKSSHFLASTLQRLFKKFPLDLEGVAVTVGPGSFTGIRVAVAAAKGIALAKSLPLIGLSSLSGFISSQQGRFASVIDARIGGAYVLIQERVGEEIRELGLARLVPLEELPALLEGCSLIVGPSFQAARGQACNPAILQQNGRIAGLTPNFAGPIIECYPDAAHLAALASRKLAQGEASLSGRLDLHYFNNPF